MKDEQLLISARINDMCGQALKYHSPAHTSFYSPAELAGITGKIKSDPNLKLHFWGGYDDSERKVVLAYPDFYDLADSEALNNASDISVLQVKNTASRNLTHRDYLGALMSMGIDRQKVGDILVFEDEALIFADDKIADYIVRNIEKISNCRVNISIAKSADKETLAKFAPKFLQKQIIVSSMRIDCIVSEAYNISRSDSMLLVKNDSVRLNYVTCNKPDKCALEGDLVSVTGKGRFIITEISGNTKKNNIIIKLSYYV